MDARINREPPPSQQQQHRPHILLPPPNRPYQRQQQQQQQHLPNYQSPSTSPQHHHSHWNAHHHHQQQQQQLPPSSASASRQPPSLSPVTTIPPPPRPDQSQKTRQSRPYIKHEDSSRPPSSNKDKKPNNLLIDRDLEDGMPPTSDFVKKLFRMLEENADEDIVSWGPLGDCFVVKDMNEFTKSILPRMFKHSNFASFVRQLNKYDFHKIKNTDESASGAPGAGPNNGGEQSWTFRHPDFQANNRDALENIKRKVPATRKSNSKVASSPAASATAGGPISADSPAAAAGGMMQLPSLMSSTSNSAVPQSPDLSHSLPPLSSTNAHLQAQITELNESYARQFINMEKKFDDMSRRYDDLARHTEALQQKHQQVLTNMDELHRNMIHHDGLFQHLLGHFVHGQHYGSKPPIAGHAAGQPIQQQQQQPVQQQPSQQQQQVQQIQQQQQPGPGPGPGPDDQYVFPSPFVPVEEAQKMITPTYTTDDVARFSLEQLNEVSRRAQNAAILNSSNSNVGLGFAPPPNPPPPGGSSSVNDGVNGVPIAQPRPALIGMSPTEAWHRLNELQKVRMPTSPPLPPPPQPALSNNNSNNNEEQDIDSETVQPSTSTLSTAAAQGEADPELEAEASRSLTRRAYPPQFQGYDGLTGRLSSVAETSGLSVLTVGHLVPRPFGDSSNSSNSTSPVLGNGNGNGNGNSSQDWHFVSSSSSSAMMGHGHGHGHGHENGGGGGVPIRTHSPPAASPPSLSATDPRQLVTLDHTYPTQPPPPPAIPRRLNQSQSPDILVRSGNSNKRQHLRVRRTTYVPGWAVPPRVLLVEDDLVSRRLSSKFLQVSGCTIDVAVDGVGAVNKMNLEKYDLVLMDIVMPKLDGISATNLIRQFDPMTPIISMTSNSKPSEILQYYSSGMNDILPKPFTRAGLITILEKHLMHLKHIRQMTTSIPRSLGEGESDNSLSNALTMPISTPSPNSAAAALAAQEAGMDDGRDGPGSNNGLNGSGNGGVGNSFTTSHIASGSNSGDMYDPSLGLGLGVGAGQINPLAGLGLSVEQYPSMLQNLLGMTGDALDVMEFDSGLMDDGVGIGGIGGIGGMGVGMGIGGGNMPEDVGGPDGDLDPSSAAVSGLKRAREEGEDRMVKRSRFEIIE